MTTITHIDKLPPAAQLLAKARALVLQPEHWTQGTLARTRKPEAGHGGFITQPNALDATCWCISGAVAKTLNMNVDTKPGDTDPWLLAMERLNKVAYKNFGFCAVDVNDQLGHEAVIQLLDFAIGEAVKEGA